MIKLLSFILLAVWSLNAWGPLAAGMITPLPAGSDVLEEKIDPDLQQTLQAAEQDELLRVIVHMKKQADLTGLDGLSRDERVRQVVLKLKETARLDQAQVTLFLKAKKSEGAVGKIIPFWVFNGLSIEARPVVVAALAARNDVESISGDEIFLAPSPQVDNLVIEPNLDLVQAPALWDLGYRGQGVVIASMDTGVYLNHPDLQADWRGGSNSWFDPYQQHPAEPTDLNGHGTQVMGVMVGGAAGGSAIGVAPDAQWIAVKIFNDQGQATTTAIHAGFQWLLDPDGNPATADAPHIVNNSWGSSSLGCNLEFQLDLQALRMANILPVFSAGNAGPDSATSTSPANNPEAFAVGAVNNLSQLYLATSRGPSNCGEPETIFPEMVAPGVEIYTSNNYGFYSTATGTSLAAPHVSGALALLLSSHPNLSANEQQAALLNGAIDFGAAGPDNDFGYGQLNVFASFQSLPPVAPTPSPTPTMPPTPTPTSTPTPTLTPTLPPLPVVNLALARPVTVSSQLDSTHTGSQAVDGSSTTYWQTAKPARKNPLTAEWITVDLGGPAALSQVVLRWGSSYATRYTLQTSANGQDWTTLSNNSSGDGGVDLIMLDLAAGRYVRLYTTAWSNSTLRLQLYEMEVYGSAENLPPTLTPTATATQPIEATVHIGDIDGASSWGNKGRWNATVTLLVHDDSEKAVAGATVSGHWNSTAIGSSACVTDTSGWCSITLSNLKDTVATVTFTVDAISEPTSLYLPAQNHDPDGDSDGTQIVITKP